MGYVLGQFDKKTTTYTGESAKENNFAKLITSGEPKRLKKRSNSIIADGDFYPFHDECIVTDLVANNNYYFHGKIQKKIKPQIFTVKLYKVSNSAEDPTENYVIPDLETEEQYIQTINIGAGQPDEFADVEFIFSPVMPEVNCIAFELERDSIELREEHRFAKILYEELSLIKNIIDGEMGLTGKKFIKIGVQSRPGLLMCINNEQIRNSRTGIFEIKNGIITISFFSVISAAQEDGSSDPVEDWMIRMENKPENTSEYLSECIFNTDKKRLIEGFTLDYLYKDEEVQG